MTSLYMYNALRGSKIDSSENTDYYYLTRLLNFRNEYNLNQISREDFADKLLSVLKKHPSFSDIDRVCVSIAYPLSNKVGVLSSATTVQENLMDSSYSCYVSRTTSLNSIQKGNIRVFSNVS